MSLASNNQPIQCTTSEQLFIDEKGGLRSRRFDDIYFHAKQGAEESQYVFLQGNQLEQRWTSDSNNNTNSNFVIAETGFGTGLNFLATWDLWRRTANAQQQTLYYYSTELYPLSFAALNKAVRHYNPFPELAKALTTQYPDPIGGDYLLEFDTNTQHPVKLILLFGDSTAALERLEHYPEQLTKQINGNKGLTVDAWFLDGFAPPRNPDNWQARLFTLIARHSGSQTTAATFSAARHVNDQFINNGFEVSKPPGFGSKRNMLTARFTGNLPAVSKYKNTHSKSKKTLSPCYFRFHDQAYTKRRAIIIGAGIAGCTMANKLATANWQVDLLDSCNQIASAASGNSRAVLYARTAQQRSALADFHEAAFHYAAHYYRSIQSTGIADGLNGMLKLGEQINPVLLAANGELRSRQNINAQQATELAGVKLVTSGIYYPDSGWLEPAAICQTLCAHQNIQFHGGISIDQLDKKPDGWHICSQQGQTFDADIIIIACGQLSNRFAQSQWLPLKSLRGQTTDLAASNTSITLKRALCEQGYITPAKNDVHAIGATYSSTNTNGEILTKDHQENINNAINLLAANETDNLWQGELQALEKNTPQRLNGRVGFRCVSPDYMPIVGPLVDEHRFRAQYASLSKNAKQAPNSMAALHNGLFVSTAFGSHGFTTAPLATEILLAQIEGKPMPIGDKLRQSISPTRFLIRNLIRGGAALT